MSKIKMVVYLVVILFCLLGSVGYAQGGLTLEGLSERVDTLFADLDSRLSKLESVEYHDGMTLDGEITCVITTVKGELQASSVAKYLKQYPDRDLPDVHLRGVWIVSDTTMVFRFKEWRGSTGLTPSIIEEYWNGCEFLGSSDWWPEAK